MSYKKYNISKPEEYTTKDGQQKTMWHNVGTLTEFSKQDGSVSKVIEIPAIGLKAQVFEIKPKQLTEGQAVETRNPNEYPQEQVVDMTQPDAIEYPEEDITPDDIPF